MGKSLTSFVLLILLTWLAWTSWQSPEIISGAQKIRAALPEPVETVPTLWRVVTRRMVWKKAAEAMHARLEETGLRVIPIGRKEDVELHAFDDVRTFAKRKEAVRAKRAWEKLGFEASIIKPNARFGVALGRLYLTAYAKQLQRRLRKNGMKYRYERRMVNIPTWRFTFPAASHAEAEKLWQRIQSLGVAEPSLMPAARFQPLYGKKNVITKL
ncbi:MAG: hypothetical protein Q9M24_01150 [Mariprofundaceae bacterium]|nr:hypothetical protein [Mariprofundaceae bacterium]